MKQFKFLLFFGLLLFIFSQNVLANDNSFTAAVNRSNVAIGDTLTLTLSLRGDSSSTPPDLSALNQNFHIIATQQGMRMSSINGQTSIVTEWVITLSPKQQGQVEIPAFELEQLYTKPIAITVVAADSATVDGQARPIFMQSTLSTETPYVQSQLIYTVKIYYAVNLIRASLTDPYVADAVVMALGKDVNYQTTVEGERYNVIERRFAIFPQKSGELEIKSPVLSGAISTANQARSSMQQFFNTGGQPVQISVPDKTITVQPKPADYNASTWLPAEDIEISEHWSTQPVRFEVGQAITRQITITATGLTGAQLPAIQIEGMENMNTYPDQAIVDSKVQDSNVIGIRSEKVAYVPTQAGKVRLPEISFEWWNSQTNQAQIASLPARTVTVLPAPEGMQAEPVLQITPAQQTVDNIQLESADIQDPVLETAADKMARQYWPWVAVSFFALWIITLLLLLKRRKRQATQQHTHDTQIDMASLTSIKNTIKQTCNAGDAKSTATALIKWGQLMWPENTIHNLIDLVKNIDDQQLTSLILALDKHLYKSHDTVWQGQDFWQAFSSYQVDNKKRSKNKDDELPSLYLN